VSSVASTAAQRRRRFQSTSPTSPCRPAEHHHGVARHLDDQRGDRWMPPNTRPPEVTASCRSAALTSGTARADPHPRLWNAAVHHPPSGPPLLRDFGSTRSRHPTRSCAGRVRGRTTNDRPQSKELRLWLSCRRSLTSGYIREWTEVRARCRFSAATGAGDLPERR
jgi:hypothetical protein